MAFNTKYRREFISRKTKKHFRIDVEEDGYAGSILEDNRNPVAPLRFIRDSSWPFFGTSIEFNLRSYSEYQFWDLYTANPRKYRTKVYENEKLVFIGYNIAETYSEPFRKTPYNVTLQAWDGLGLLKNVDWDSFIDSLSLIGRENYMTLIRSILNQLDLQIDLHFCAPIYEDSMNTFSLSFTQVEERFEKYYGKQNTLYDVLTFILNRFDCYLTMKDAAWHIVSSIAQPATHDYYVYDYQGNYVESYTKPAVYQLGSSNEMIMAGADASIEINPQPEKIIINSNYGMYDNIFTSFDVEEDDITEYVGSRNYNRVKIISANQMVFTRQGYSHNTRTKYDSTTVVESDSFFAVRVNSISGIQIIDCSYLLKAYTDSQLFFGVNNATGGDGFVQNSSPFQVFAQNDFVLRFDLLYISFVNVTYSFQIEIWLDADNGNNYYLTSTGWGTTQAYYDMDQQNRGEWKSHELLTDIPYDGVIRFRVLIKDGMDFFMRNFKAFFFDDQEGSLPAGADTEISIEPHSSEKAKEINVVACDYPGYANDEAMYENGMTIVSDGSHTSAWKIIGETNTYNIDQLLALIVASKNRQPRIKFNAVLINFRYDNNMQILDENGDPILDENGTPIQYADLGINFESIIQIDVNGSRNFAIETGTHDAYNETYDVEMIELLPYQDTSV